MRSGCSIKGMLRIGGEEYADENGGVGLATLRAAARPHRQRRRRLRLPGQERQAAAAVVHRPGTSREILAALKRRRGPRPDAPRLQGPALVVAVRSARDQCCTSRRPPAGRVQRQGLPHLARHRLRRGRPRRVTARRARGPARERAIVRAVADTAGRLGNTPAVCRASYIDPASDRSATAPARRSAGPRPPRRPAKSRPLADSQAPMAGLRPAPGAAGVQPRPVQRVADLGRPDQPGYPLPSGARRVETGGLLGTA